MKNNKFLLLIIVIGALFLTGCKNTYIVEDNYIIDDSNVDDPILEEPKIQEPEEVIEIDEIKFKLDKMTIDEKIGQLLIVGFEESEVNESTIEIIEDYKIGGFVLFARNIIDENQLVDLINNLKTSNNENSIPLFISIDEEGGKVSRLPKIYNKLPESNIIGDYNDSQLSYGYGVILGKRLDLVGINLNFAPVLDINSNEKNPVIGSRAYGNTAEVVIDVGIQVLKGIESTGIIPAVKHFPGHGDTSIDSHLNLPVVNKSLKDLEQLELLPFIRAIEEDVDMVMIAHILFPELDAKYPSTMSKIIVNDLLRGDLGFKGTIISDDMTMGAIVENYTIEDATLNFLKAGGDIALICHGKDNPILVINHIKDSIDNGEITLAEIDDKVYRILTLKEKYKLKDNIIHSINTEDINVQTQELLNKINK